MNYIIGIDQSTQGTKALLFDENGTLCHRCDLPHEQIINEKGWVSHDPEEILRNTIAVTRTLIAESGVHTADVKGIGISNQRETSVIWDRETGKPLANAIVWQCSRASEICRRPEIAAAADMVRERTGLNLSPYFPAAKIAWLLENVPGARERADEHKVCHGTIDSWLVYSLSIEKAYKTDASNASRTQLLNLATLEWDPEVCALFGIDPANMAEVCASDSCYGYTDLGGFFEKPIPIHGVLGDSHAALFGQDCTRSGMTKATYGTGSSVMMNVGEKPVFSPNGVVSSIAWKMGATVEYVLEGNINYTGAVISWLKDNVKLISSAKETQALAENANPLDKTYLVPAFTGLGTPYWNDTCTGVITGITRTTGKNEIVRAALDCIAYQIADIVRIMGQDSGLPLAELRVDGGPTGNCYLMQFQSDILGIPVRVAAIEELSGMGAAFAAGLGMGVFEKEKIYGSTARKIYTPAADAAVVEEKLAGWKKAINQVLNA